VIAVLIQQCNTFKYLSTILSPASLTFTKYHCAKRESCHSPKTFLIHIGWATFTPFLEPPLPHLFFFFASLDHLSLTSVF
jgi:hypothetical protein